MKLNQETWWHYLAHNHSFASRFKEKMVKKILWYSFVELCQVVALHFQCIWIWKYLHHIKIKHAWKLLFIHFLLSGAKLTKNLFWKVKPSQRRLFTQSKKWSYKIWMAEKQKIHNRFRRKPNRSFNNIYFKNIHIRATKLAF